MAPHFGGCYRIVAVGAAYGLLEIAGAGVHALGTWEPLPIGSELIEYWKAQLGKAEREILDVLKSGDELTKEEIARRTVTGYAANGGGFGNALGRLRTLELIQGHGRMRLNPELFGG